MPLSRETREQAAKTRLFYIVIIGLGVVGTAMGVFLSGLIFGGISAETLQQRLIENCETTRSPLNSYFKGEIEATKHTDYSELFPNIAPGILERLTDAKIERLHSLVVTFDPEACSDQYES